MKNKLKALLTEKNIKTIDLADQIEMKYDTLLKKLNGHIPFKQEEIALIKDKLKIADKDVYKYFF